MPLSDRRLVQGAAAAAAAAARLVPRRIPRPAAAALLLPPAVRADGRACSGVSGMPVAFKLGSVLGVFLLPLLRLRLAAADAAAVSGAAARGGRGARLPLRRGEPDLGRHRRLDARGRVLLHVRDRLSPLLFLGELLRAREDGRGPWLPAAAARADQLRPRLRRAVGGAHRRGPAALGSAAAARARLAGRGRRRSPSRSRRPRCCRCSRAWGWTTPYDDAWIDVTTRGLLPALLWPLFACAAVALAWSSWRGSRGRRPVDRRLLFWPGAPWRRPRSPAPAPGWASSTCASSPFAQLSLALCGAAALGLAVSQLALADVAALGARAARGRARRRALDATCAPGSTGTTRGSRRRSCGPRGARSTTACAAESADPRVAVEYDPLHERAGSMRMYETLPFFSGRSTLEGVYNQASTVTHPVYYLASELFARSPNPFRSRTYSRFDPRRALARLRLFNVGAIVATSPALKAALDRASATSSATPRSRPTRCTACATRGPATWSRSPSSRCARRCAAGATSATAGSPASRPIGRCSCSRTTRASLSCRPIPGRRRPSGRCPAASTSATRVEAESIRIQTDRPGHPLLVKVSYHPRWRLSGGAGPYLVSPGLMLIVPSGREVLCATRHATLPTVLGLALALGAPDRRRVAQPARRRSRRRPLDAGRRSALAPARCRGIGSGRCGRCRCCCALALARAAAAAAAVARRRGRRSSTSGPRGPTPRSAGRRPPSWPATRSADAAPPTRGGTSCSACRAKPCSRRGTRARRRSPSSPWWRRAGRTRRRRSSPARGRVRRPATLPARRPGVASCVA